MINCSFTFRATIFGLLWRRYGPVRTLNAYVCGFQITHRVNQFACQHIIYQDTTKQSGCLTRFELLRAYTHCKLAWTKMLPNLWLTLVQDVIKIVSHWKGEGDVWKVIMVSRQARSTHSFSNRMKYDKHLGRFTPCIMRRNIFFRQLNVLC